MVALAVVVVLAGLSLALALAAAAGTGAGGGGGGGCDAAGAGGGSGGGVVQVPICNFSDAVEFWNLSPKCGLKMMGAFWISRPNHIIHRFVFQAVTDSKLWRCLSRHNRRRPISARNASLAASSAFRGCRRLCISVKMH